MALLEQSRRAMLEVLGGSALAAESVGAVTGRQSDDGGSHSHGGAGTDDLYVACRDANALAVVDRRERRVTDEISVGQKPTYVSVAPNGQAVFATNSKSQTVSVVDPGDRTEEAQIPVGTSPKGLNVSPDSKHLLVANEGDDAVTLIDVEDREREGTIDVGEVPHNLVYGPDGEYAYVTNQESDSVSVVDLEARTEVDRIDVAAYPHNLQYDVSDDRIYTVNWHSNDVGVLDVESRELLRKRPATDGNADVDTTRDGGKILVTGVQSDAVVVYRVLRSGDRRYYRVEDIVTVFDEDELDVAKADLGFVRPGLGPHGVLVPPDGHEAYVAVTGLDQVVVLDVGTLEITDRIDTPAFPFFLSTQRPGGN